jgi:hypothetical protein
VGCWLLLVERYYNFIIIKIIIIIYCSTSFPLLLILVGIVEKIVGEELHMIFTQWEGDSRYYREVAHFGKDNLQCKGVRKIEIGII